MINQETRRLDAEKIRQEFIKSTKFKITPRPVSASASSYPRAVPTSPSPIKPL